MRILYLAAAAVLVTGGATACGSSSKNSAAVSSSPTLGTAAKEAKARQFVACARQNGIPNVADPTVNADGGVEVSPPPGLTKQSPIVQKVLKVCGKYLEGVVDNDNDQKGDKITYDQALKIAACIRQHGIPNFPDPPAPGSSPRQVPINKSDPRLRKAMDTCRQYVTVHGK